MRRVPGALRGAQDPAMLSLLLQKVRPGARRHGRDPRQEILLVSRVSDGHGHTSERSGQATDRLLYQSNESSVHQTREDLRKGQSSMRAVLPVGGRRLQRRCGCILQTVHGVHLREVRRSTQKDEGFLQPSRLHSGGTESRISEGTTSR